MDLIRISSLDLPYVNPKALLKEPQSTETAKHLAEAPLPPRGARHARAAAGDHQR